MKPNSIDAALNNYIGLRQQDIKPFFLLDAELLTVWRNAAAMKMPSPPDHWRERLQSSGSIQKWLRQLNKERFIVWDNLVENQIVLLTGIGIPTEQPYLELSLWLRDVITAEMPYDTRVLALEHSLDSGSFYSETAVVDTKDFYTSLCLAADRILNVNGVTIRLMNGYGGGIIRLLPAFHVISRALPRIFWQVDRRTLLVTPTGDNIGRR